MDENIKIEHDNRLKDELPYYVGSSVNTTTKNILKKEQSISCKLLEQATGGRLTFIGDRIVTNNGGK